MTRTEKRLLVEGLGYSSCGTSNHHAEWVRLSAAGLVDRREGSIFGIRSNSVQLTDKGKVKAKELLAKDRTLAPSHWRKGYVDSVLGITKS